uniref:CAPA n=1 Tax=Carausius morosus TaxID=7022 RepID=A0A6G4ZWD4_CARMO|nr:CAPA [Carausius morosus]
MTGCALVYLLILAFAVNGYHGGEVVQRKQRHVSGLIPFPRIGRSGGDVTWTLDSPELQEAKRQGLIAFPRVGRAGRYGYLVVRGEGRRDTGGDNGGMWFGPRLGRRDRRSTDLPSPWALVALRDYPSQRRHDAFYQRAEGGPHDDEEDVAEEEAADGTGRVFRDQAASS